LSRRAAIAGAFARKSGVSRIDAALKDHENVDIGILVSFALSV
jgi:hypothetical protein